MNLVELARVYLRIGNTTFGGGDATIAALQREFVNKRRMLTDEQFGLLNGLSRVTPGTNMIAFIAGSAWIFGGWLASLVAVGVVTVPTAALAVLITDAYETWSANAYTGAAIAAMTAAAVGMMFAAALLLVKSQWRRSRALRAAVLVTGSFLLSWKTPLSAVQTLGIAALAGYFWPEPKAE